jgi:hypothetical protein
LKFASSRHVYSPCTLPTRATATALDIATRSDDISGDVRHRCQLSIMRSRARRRHPDVPPVQTAVVPGTERRRINSERRSHDTTGECPQPSQRGHGLDSRARAKLITDWPSRQADLQRGENLVHEPGSAGHKSETDDEPRFTEHVAGLFASTAYSCTAARKAHTLRIPWRTPRQTQELRRDPCFAFGSFRFGNIATSLNPNAHYTHRRTRALYARYASPNLRSR